MSDIHTSDWSTTAASNNATPPNGWPENMDFSKVNDSARENMAALKRWYNDISGVNTAAGTATAYTLAADRTIASYAAGQVFCFIVGTTNTGAVTLNVDSVGAKAIKKHHDVALAPGDLEADMLAVVAYKATEDVFQLLSPTAAEHYRNVNNLTAAPGVGDDTADGYQAGSLAVDTTNDRAYVCVDNSAGAAIWREIGTALVPIETLTASSSATLDFDSGIDSTYDDYILVCKGLTPATDDVQLLARIATAGPTWQAGAGAYQWGGSVVSIGGTVAGDGSSSGGPTTAMCLNGSATSKVGSASGEGVDLVIRFSAPAGSNRKRFAWQGVFTTAAGNDAAVSGAGSYGSTTAIVGVRLLFSSGNIASGSATLYGVRT